MLQDWVTMSHLESPSGVSRFSSVHLESILTCKVTLSKSSYVPRVASYVPLVFDVTLRVLDVTLRIP